MTGERSAGALGVAALGCLTVALFFRVQILTGFDTLFGDRYDGAIETAILEHWYNVFRGVSHWSQTLYFYPARDTLGYNDGYFLYGVAYAGFRLLGCDPYLASECVNIVVKLVGFAAFQLFARRALRLSRWWAAAGACVFTLSNNSYMASGHAQMFAAGLAPALATLLHAMLAATGRRAGAAALGWGAAAAALFSAWLVTAYYTAWFFVLFAMVLVPVLAVTAPSRSRRAFLADMRACWAPLLAVLVAFVAGLTPFLWLYLPKAAETGMHDFATVWDYTLRPLDLLNVGAGNLFYRPLIELLPFDVFLPDEHVTGFTPALLLLFITAGLAAWVPPPDARHWLARGLFLGTLITWMLAVRIGGQTLWAAIYAVVPGAKAARVVARIQIFLDWPVVTVAAAGLEALSVRLRRHPALAVAAPALLAAFCAAEQLSDWDGLHLNRPAELAWLRSIPVPPTGCRAFFVSAPRRGESRMSASINDLVGHDVDAMLIAERLRIPTINGFASFEPPGWNLLWIGHPDYMDRIRQDAALNHLGPELCGLDLATGRWAAPPGS